MGLVLVVEHDGIPRLRHALNRFALPDWATRGTIKIWGHRDRVLLEYPLDARREWNNLRAGDEVFVSSGVYCRHEDLSSKGVSVTKYSLSLMSHDRQGFLSRMLRRHRSHWRDGVLEQCTKWNHAFITDEYVDQWLKQFQAFGDQHIAQKLLQSIRVLAPHETTELLALNRFRIGEKNRQIAFLSGLGKSGGTLAHGVRKASETPRCITLAEVIRKVRHGGRRCCVEVVEDGLWTGIEVMRALRALQRNDGEALKSVPIGLNFAVKTDLGMYAVRSFLRASNLLNIEVREDVGITKYVLTSVGKEAFETNRVGFDDVEMCKLPEDCVMPLVFGYSSVWSKEQDISRATDLLKHIGPQLWQHWLTGKGLTWDKKRLENVALGANSIGSSIIFAHTVPKCALPVYWGSGTIQTHSGRRQDWSSLFRPARKMW